MSEGREFSQQSHKEKRGTKKEKQSAFAEWKARFDAAQTTNKDSHETYGGLPLLEDPKAVKDFIVQELQKEDDEGWDAKTLKYLEKQIIRTLDTLALTDIPDTAKKDCGEIINIILQERLKMYQVYKEIQGDVYLHTREYIQTILEICSKLELVIDRSLIYDSLEELRYKSNVVVTTTSNLINTAAEYLAFTTSPKDSEQLVQDIQNFIQSAEARGLGNVVDLKILADKLETRVEPHFENGVVTYLGNEYVIEGEFPSPVDTVKQLDHNGKFGLLRDGVLLGYIQTTDTSPLDSPEYLNPNGEFGEFNLGLLLEYAQKKRDNRSSKTAAIPCKFYTITPKDIFHSQTSDTHLVEDFLQNYSEFQTSLYQNPPKTLKRDSDLDHEKIATEMRVETALQNLGLREQFLAYTFIKKYPEKLEQLTEFIVAFGQNGLSTFSAAEYDSEIPLALLEIVNEDDPEAMNHLFEYFAHFNYMVNAIGSYTAHFFKRDTSVSQEDIDKVTQSLSERSYHLTALVANSIKETGKVADDVWNSLNNFKQSIALFAETFKTFFKDKEHVDFSEIRHVQLEKIDAQELSGADKKQMLSIAERNWKPEGHVGEEVLKKFEESLTEPGVDYYILKKSKEVVAFMRLGPPTTDKHRSIGSFNVDSNARGAGIGEAMLLASTAQEAETYILDSSVLPKFPIGMKYVQKGSHINGLIENFNNTGETFFQLQINKHTNERITSKNMSPTELLKRLEIDEIKDPSELIKEEQNIVVLAFSEVEKEKMLQNMKLFLDHGYIGTDYRLHPKEKGKRIYVLEFLAPEEGSDSSS